MTGLKHILSRLPAGEHFRRVTGKVDPRTGEIIGPPSRPHQPGAGISFAGYCPRTCKAAEAVKRVLLWAFAKNGGDRAVISISTLQRLLAEHHGVMASRRTVTYALKRLQLDGYITRQSRWVKLASGAIQRARSITRPKGRLLREQLDRGYRGLRLLALGVRPAGEGVVQRIARGYQELLANVVPDPLSTGA